MTLHHCLRSRALHWRTQGSPARRRQGSPPPAAVGRMLGGGGGRAAACGAFAGKAWQPPEEVQQGLLEAAAVVTGMACSMLPTLPTCMRCIACSPPASRRSSRMPPRTGPKSPSTSSSSTCGSPALRRTWALVSHMRLRAAWWRGVRWPERVRAIACDGRRCVEARERA